MGRPFLLACLLASLPAAGGCRSAPRSGPEPAAEPRKIELTGHRRGPRYRSPPARPPIWFEQQIAAAEADLAGGRLREGLERVYRALDKTPGPEHEARLKTLVERFNRAVLQLPTLEGRLEPQRESIEFGERVRLRLVLTNPGTRRVHVPAKPAHTSGSLVVLRVTRKEVDIEAQVVTTVLARPRPLERDLEIPPGGRVELLLDLGLLGNDRGLDGYRRYLVEGVLRPARLEVGGLRRWEAIRLAPAGILSCRPNFRHLADDPVARLRQALEKNAPLHLLTASALVAPQDRRAAVDVLIGGVRGDRPIDWAIYAALQQLTGIELGRDAAAWRAWWPRVRVDFFASGKKREAPRDRPVFGE